MVSLPQGGHNVMLVITSKGLQRFNHCHLTVNNMTSPFQSSVSGTCANVQIKYHPHQCLHKFFLAECYLLQDFWANDLECLHQIYSHVILDSWESDDIYITDIPDPRFLAVRSSVSKYNKDNPSWDAASISG
jgi:hypothetical protein